MNFVIVRVRQELEDSKLDIEGLKKLLELKTKELRKLKVRRVEQVVLVVMRMKQYVVHVIRSSHCTQRCWRGT